MKHCYVNTTVLNEMPMVAVLENAISAEQCQYLIDLAANSMQRAKVSLDEGSAIVPGRTGSNTWLRYSDNDTVREIGEKISKLVGIPLENAEAIQVIHYGPEQKYGAHYDAYDLSTERGKRCCARGGQRLVTCLIYLNEVSQGGSTSFPKLKITVPAQKGKMLIFNNVEHGNYGAPHPQSLHGGDPVIEGEKWACNIWFHERIVNESIERVPDVQSGKQLPALGLDVSVVQSKFVCNRSMIQLEKAAVAVESLLRKQPVFTLFSYWDTFDPRSVLQTQGYTRVIRTIHRPTLNELANKKRLGQLIAQHDLTHLAAPVFSSVSDALQSGVRATLWFVKNIHGSGGKEMQCITQEQLEDFQLPQHHIVQAGIESLDTMNGKKYTIRAYVLVFKGQMWLYENAITIAHGSDYIENSTAFDVQISHAGYMNPDSAVKINPLSDAPEGNAHFLEHASKLFQKLLPVLQDVVRASSEDEYIVLGVDLLKQKNGNYRLVEINTFPNFTHTTHVNDTVNIPMWTQVMLMILGEPGKGFHLLEKASGV